MFLPCLLSGDVLSRPKVLKVSCRIEDALATGRFHCVLGDREAAVDTYREFVIFDEAQIYPEYATRA